MAMSAAIFPGYSFATTVIVSEDFESYADTVALGGTWSLGDGTLDTVSGNPGASMNHPGTGASFSGGNTNSLSFSGIYPGVGETLVFSADIYDDGSGTNRRNSAGIRAASGANIIEMGMYNSPAHYSYRTVLFGAGSDGSWVAFDNLLDDAGQAMTNDPVVGWHRFTAEITNSQVTFSLDLNSDGNINGTAVADIFQNGAFDFDIIRLGGPSDLGSSSGGAKFDNIGLTLEPIPEPSATVLGSFGLLGLLVRRR